MKKRKVLFLLPVAALILSGCTIQEGWESVGGFFTNSVYEPVKNWVENLLGIKHEEKKDDKKQDDSGEPDVAGDDVPVEVPDTVIGSIENPISVADFQTQLDALIDYAAVEENKTEVDSSHLFFVKAKVTGSTALNEYKECNFLNMVDEQDATKQVTGYWTVVDSSITEDFSAKDSLKGRTVIVKGYGALYKKVKNNQETKTYELMKKDNDNKATVVKVFDKEVVPGANYGSLENPLTVSEAKATIDLDNPTSQKIYVTGVVTSNSAWDSGYKNVFKIFLTDGENEVYLFKCTKFPSNVTAENITEDMFKGKAMVVSGTGEIYQGGYELTESEVHSINEVAIDKVELSAQHLDLEVGQLANLSASVSPSYASQEVEWSISQTSQVVSYENGKVTALAAGEATITATSTADQTKSASCTVSVTAATKELVGITISGNAKTAYTEGEAYSSEGLVVTANYSDQSTEDVTALVEWNYSKETAEENDTQITITAIYSNHTDQIDVTVTVTIVPGSLAHPYSVAEAYAVFEGLETGANSAEVYVEGYIDASPAPAIGSNRGNFYLTDGSANRLYVYGANGITNSADVTLADLPVGGKALVRGAIKNYNGAFQLCFVSGTAQCQLVKAVEAPVITSVGNIVGPTEVSVNGTVNPANVTVEVVYNNVVHATVTAATATGDFSQAGEATVNVTIEGYNGALSYTITVVSGTVLVETEVYKLDGTDASQGSNGYATVSDVTFAGVAWDVTANTTINPWRFGGKNISETDRKAESRAAVSTDDITKVVVNTGTATATVHSVSLLVGTSQGASDISSLTKTSDLTSAALEFARPENTSWAGRYFTIVFNVTCGSSNQYIQLTSAQFFAMK